jgi:hypothetical protein
VPAASENNAKGTIGLELDNGRRWKVNEAMLFPIQRMEERITASVRSAPLDTAQAHQLADSLFVDLDELVAGCTMEGRAHAELHDWLMPHMRLVQELEGVDDEAKAANVLARSDSSMTVFHRFFE